MFHSTMDDKFPFVSICTPTHNRRPFIPSLIKSIEQQRYPINRIEWIIVDDGSDSIQDLVKDISYVKYFRYNYKLPLGLKRNIMNSHASGEYLVYFDDDDYYPPTRIYHAITSLLQNPQYNIAGSSEMLIYYNHLQQIWKLGPNVRNHATAATFAFHRKLLNITRFNDADQFAEEKHFLKKYSIPLLQLNPTQTILVFSHLFNTFDKKILLKNGSGIRKTSYDPKYIIEGIHNQNFYLRDMTAILMYYKYDFLQRLHSKNKNDMNLSLTTSSKKTETVKELEPETKDDELRREPFEKNTQQKKVHFSSSR